MPKKSNNEIQLIILGQSDEDGDESTLDLEQAEWDLQMDSLWRRNQLLGALHLFNGVAGFTLSQTVDNMKEFTIPLTTLFLDWDRDTSTATQELKVVWNFQFVAWTSMFAFMSAAAHFWVLWKWDKYTTDLARGLNRFRWWEYAVSSSLMIMLIAMLFGVYDVYSQIFIGCINAAMNLFGDIMEVRNAGKKPEDVDWVPFIYGGIAGSYSWIIIFTFMLGSPGVDGAPWFVWVILATYIILFFTFPWTMYNQYAQNGKYNNELYPLLKNGGYLMGERHYGYLSLVAKTLLVWLVISGSNQPTAADTY